MFANVLLADEINRTLPRTQSALLEVMSEGQVTIDGQRRDLPRPFFVIATQNPVEFHGTYPLPEAQLDRFAARIALGYPNRDAEIDVLFGQNHRHPFESLTPVATCAQVLALQEQVRRVTVERAVAEYIIRLVHATRNDPRLRLGVSPRGSLALYRMAQASAALAGRSFVTPDDVRALALPTLAHRLLFDTRSKYAGAMPAAVIEEVLSKVTVPR